MLGKRVIHLLTFSFATINLIDSALTYIGYYLSDYSCATSCPTGKTPNTIDRICKSTQYDTDNPCPHGTYNNQEGAQGIDSCQPCEPGRYCPFQGEISSKYKCDPGFYCTFNSSFARPSTELSTIDIVPYFKSTYGNYCSLGQYCPSESGSPIDCEPGFYCPRLLMSAFDVNLKCAAGFYCTGGASIKNPTDNTTGNICPAGYYCPEGSINKIPCPTGTFLSYTGAFSKQNCSACTPGKYCDQVAMTQPAGPCSAGYYCPSGQSSPTPVQYYCPIGFYCQAGSPAPQKCPPGYYSFSQMTTACVICPAGKYCSERNFAQECDAGNYCPGQDLRINCPLGSYSSSISLTAETQCLDCPAGKSCHSTGLSQPASTCQAGFYCTGKSISTRPNNINEIQGGNMCKPGEVCVAGSSINKAVPLGRYQNYYAAFEASGQCEAGYYCPAGSKVKNQLICQQGFFCESGSGAPIPCPAGKYSKSMGAPDSSYCIDCPGGKYCSKSGEVSISGDCSAGYYCPFGQLSSKPIQYLCPAGYQCPAGSTFPSICEAGTYQPNTGSSSCLDCPAGQYCEGYGNGTSTKQCDKGYYCPIRTQFATQYPCPIGTYNPDLGATSSINCLPCPAGYYCDRLAQTYFNTKTLKGYFSPKVGNSQPDPILCPSHSYCEEGSIYPKFCPKGLMTLSTGLTKLDDCLPCPRGKFCNFFDYFNQNLLSSITTSSGAEGEKNSNFYGNCNDGYICLSGSGIRNPTNNVNGYKCPAGYYCIAGEPDKRPCLPGQYQDLEGQKVCKSCPAGSYCPDFGTAVLNTCPSGSYCIAKAFTPTPCKPGTFNNKTGQTQSTACTSCTQGQFCSSYGLYTPDGNCSAGYICQSGSTNSFPYSPIYVLRSLTSGICPRGYYCEEGVSQPVACKIGTYNNDLGATSCKPCPPGKYCATEGLQAPTGDCYEGYKCEEGQSVPNPLGSQCSAADNKGYCPAGAVAYYKCRDGFLMNELTGICELCPDGKICKNNVIYKGCPKYKYCDDHYENPYGKLCPNGFYSNAENLTKNSSCKPCTQGKFCQYGQIVGNCSAGYICNYGANYSTPNKSDGAYPCPKGFYCSTGVLVPEVCPLGTYTFETGAFTIGQCDYCRAGFYCEYGALEPIECPEGNYCPQGSQEPTNCTLTRYNPFTMGKSNANCLGCKGGYYCKDYGLGNLFQYNTTYRCPFGNYCPVATWRPYPCKAGTYSDDTLRLPPATLTDCLECPQHYYCPTGTGFRYKHPCPGGSYCPAGSSYPILCPAGYYCAASLSKNMTVITIKICPKNSYCPLGSQAPIPCNLAKGEICPAGASFPSISKTTSTICSPGSYFGYGQCNLCEAGYLCVNNTNTKYPLYLTTEGGQECPAGNYCPRGSSKPTQCPKGTYRPITRGKSVEDCFDCTEGSYNVQTGQVACVKCGRGSTNTTDFQACQCLGNFRLWRASDNQCVCKSPYLEPVVKNDDSQTSTDTQDCVPPVEQDCTAGSHFDSSTSTCVSDEICKQASLCNGNGVLQGYYSATQQICLCGQVSGTSRLLQSLTNDSSINTQDSQIICARQGSQLKFQVSKQHFPVFIINSVYNTNPTFDSGLFDNLRTRILNAGMLISNFYFSFVDQGTYMFGDYSDQKNTLIFIKISSECPAQYSISPLTLQNLERYSITPQEVSMKKMSDSLIVIPIVFILFTVVSTGVQKVIEARIERMELERRLRRAGRRRNFQNEDGKLDKKQYLSDLYKLIKDNLDEVKKLIDSHDSRDSLYKLLRDKTSLAKELGDNGKSVMDELKNQLSRLLGELRFPDGRTLREVLSERLLQRRLQEVEIDEDHEEEHDDLMDDSAYNRTDSGYGDEEDEDENDELIDAAGQNFHDSDDENLDKIKKMNKNQNLEDLDRKINLKQEQEKRKLQFQDRIGDLVGDDDKQKLLEGYDSKMRQLDNLLNNESKKQDDILAARLAARKQKKKQLTQQLDERVKEKEQKLEDLKEEQAQMFEDFDDIVEHGMKDQKLKDIQEKEKQEALDKLDKQKDQQLQAVRDEYLIRIKNARNPQEKEMILDEMQRRLSSIEDQLNKEKTEQERNLEKILKERQSRRVKKMAKEQDKRIEEKGKEILTLQRDIEKEKAQIYVEMGGKDVSELIDDSLKSKIQDIIKKVDKKQLTLELDQIDKDQLEILKVQQNLEKDKALKNIEREIEEQSEDDKSKLEDQLKQKLQKERDEYNQKIAKAKNENDRKKLIKESKKREKKIQDEIQNEKLRQERMLDEKKMNRQNRRKIKELEIESKQMEDYTKKEVELLNKKFQQQDQASVEVFEKEINQAIAKIEQRKDAGKEQALILANESTDEMIRKRLKLLIHKQFHELEKYLGTMYTQTAMSKLIAKEKIKDKYNNLEEEAYKNLHGDQLVQRLNALKEEEQLEISMIDDKIAEEEREREAEIREKLEEQFSKEKTDLISQDSNKKKELIENIMKRNKDDEMIKILAPAMIQNTARQTQEDLEKLERERQDNLDKIKLQIVAENEAEVQDMQRKIEEQMNKEKEAVEQRMKHKRDEIIGDKKKRLEEKINEMKGTLSEYQREMIMKQYQTELDALEKAIADERDAQLTKMRQKLIKRKIERERLRKEEEQKKKMEEVKINMIGFLKNKIKENREHEKARILHGGSESESVDFKDKLKMMLSKWSDDVDKAKQDIEDPTNIWEKTSQDSLRSSASKMSKMSKMSKLSKVTKGTTTSKFANNLQGIGSNAPQQNYTMEELVKRIRRIEKLTDKMSNGKVRPSLINEAKNAISHILSGSPSQDLIN